MKKLLSLALVLGLGAMLMAGCNSTSSGTASTSVTATAAATSVAALASTSLGIDNSILGVFSYASVKTSGMKIATPGDIAYGSDGWWTCLNTWEASAYSYRYEYAFKAWDKAGAEIKTAAGLKGVAEMEGSDKVSKMWTFTNFTTTWTATSGTVSITYQFGESKDKPLKFEGIGTASYKIDGYTKYSGSYAGESYDVIMNYNSLTLTTAGYPSGTVSFSLKVSAGEAYAGTITYDGTSTATLAITSGGTGTYTVNLDSGAVVAAMVN